MLSGAFWSPLPLLFELAKITPPILVCFLVLAQIVPLYFVVMGPHKGKQAHESDGSDSSVQLDQETIRLVPDRHCLIATPRKLRKTLCLFPWPRYQPRFHRIFPGWFSPSVCPHKLCCVNIIALSSAIEVMQLMSCTDAINTSIGRESGPPRLKGSIFCDWGDRDPCQLFTVPAAFAMEHYRADLDERWRDSTFQYGLERPEDDVDIHVFRVVKDYLA